MTFRRVALAATIGLLPLTVSAAASADPPPDTVDVARLQPALNPDFAPWTCKPKQDGPVCTGEWNLSTAWELTDLPCAVPVYARSEFHRRSTRYYDWDYRNFDRFVHQKDVDYLSTSANGPATGSITASTRFSEPFGIPGDVSTMTVITEGVPLDVRSAQGRSLLRTVGTYTEPTGEVGTFTGHLTADGVTTHYDGVALPDLFSEEQFIAAICLAATGTA